MYRERINTLINNQMNSTEDEELRKYLSSLIPKESFIANMLNVDISQSDYDEIIDKLKKTILSYVKNKYPFHLDIQNVYNDNLIQELSKRLKYEYSIIAHKDSYKIYPVSITSKFLEEKYNECLNLIAIESLSSKKTIMEIMKEKETKLHQENIAKEQYLKTNTMEPYYGDPYYMYEHAIFINECIKKIGGVFLIDDDIKKMKSFIETYPQTGKNIDNKEYPYIDIKYKINYDIFESAYYNVLEAEANCSLTAEREWCNFLTNPQKHNNQHFAYLTKPAIDVENNKNVLSLVTNTFLPLEDNTYGLIYEYNPANIITISPSPILNTNKQKFIEDGLPITNQLINPEEECSYYKKPKNSKLYYPNQFAEQIVKDNIALNKNALGILNYDEGKVLGELEFKDTQELSPIGIYYTDGYEDIVSIQKEANNLNIPLIHLSLVEQKRINMNNISDDIKAYMKYIITTESQDSKNKKCKAI